MITEPEFDGSFDPGDRPSEAASADPALPPASRSRRPWLWSLGGALTASAVWAAGLWAAGVPGPAERPGYRWPEYLCDEFTAPTLSRLTGIELTKHKLDANQPHRAVDWSGCQLSGERDGIRYLAVATVAVHHVTDPGPEFEVARPHDPRYDPWVAQDAMTVEAVPGLGERALLSYDGPYDARLLRVLDGRAVFTLTFSAQPDYREAGPEDIRDPDPKVDFTAAQAAMAEDVRILMRALRT
ncbi:hypothetical protein [Streptomyces antimicrobicus]|uniref:DUF3558 domain-containing protein n=1 Tax=Streptomyces antimicrobicus TaxID=2883108 RepID=A0ABS8BCM9_9ACTN|nr:hypothetical protein [Streptomyces antimicrobicus]MCB5182289.1 hypothetical protein [Streptomyces antimicrobicus]